MIVTVIVPRASSVGSPETLIVSVPSSFSVPRLMPSGNCSGRTPMPTRFERWMRSYDSAMTTLTPRSSVPLAAQSREEPEPYSRPAMMISGTPSAW